MNLNLTLAILTGLLSGLAVAIISEPYKEVRDSLLKK